VTEYCVVIASGPWSFAEAVQNRMKLGWIPQGGLAVVQDGLTENFYQAMVR